MDKNTKILLGIAIIGVGAYLINMQLKAQKQFLGFGKNEKPNFIRKIFEPKASEKAKENAAPGVFDSIMMSNPESVKRFTKKSL